MSQQSVREGGRSEAGGEAYHEFALRGQKRDDQGIGQGHVVALDCKLTDPSFPLRQAGERQRLPGPISQSGPPPISRRYLRRSEIQAGFPPHTQPGSVQYFTQPRGYQASGGREAGRGTTCEVSLHIDKEAEDNGFREVRDCGIAFSEFDRGPAFLSLQTVEKLTRLEESHHQGAPVFESKVSVSDGRGG